ncbi:hypothetical protein [Paenibacillus abyssi]|uniref:Uncharacterized protein n=1 Tax=Paenibacillus abyssi TaxID=1340531 RepID=A0A917CTV7_9BACL|nr:hypothetical protein [Paenibacillus abyssi]GGF98687.1 hypothetical protein GCM10010916_14910 [Paenibacillus abyssi]
MIKRKKSADVPAKAAGGRKTITRNGTKTTVKKITKRGRRTTFKRRKIPVKQNVSYNKAYDAGFDEAYNEGFDVGYAEGLQAGHQEAYKGE